MAPIHDRMPVILGSENWHKWLGDDNELKAMLKPLPSDAPIRSGNWLSMKSTCIAAAEYWSPLTR
jgi:putative SOS response-associated peptidase YedK